MKQTALNIDCIEYMRGLPDKAFDLAIVDPPYGSNDAIGLKNGGGHAAKRKNYKGFENTAPESEYFTELFRVSNRWIIWGGNFFGIQGGVIAWDKHGTAFGEGEVAICNTHKSVRFFDYTWNGMIQGNMKQKEERIHDCQKPVALYKWLLQNYAKQGDRILDTHLGSGSSRIAAFDLGFEFVGCELDKDYFDMREKRFAEHVIKNGNAMFRPDNTVKIEQNKLFE